MPCLCFQCLLNRVLLEISVEVHVKLDHIDLHRLLLIANYLSWQKECLFKKWYHKKLWGLNTQEALSAMAESIRINKSWSCHLDWLMTELYWKLFLFYLRTNLKPFLSQAHRLHHKKYLSIHLFLYWLTKYCGYTHLMILPNILTTEISLQESKNFNIQFCSGMNLIVLM